MTRLRLGALLTVGLLLAPSSVCAQSGGELGVSLVNATVGLAENRLASAGAPVSGFGLQSPAIYASIFLGPHVAIEPQFSFAWVTYRGNWSHVGSIGLQADYFMRGLETSSPYLFALGGVSHAGGADAFWGAGAGYRVVRGRLAFRFDAKYLHFFEAIRGASDNVAVGISIGGVFGR
jgi:hypothetical protein